MMTRARIFHLNVLQHFEAFVGRVEHLLELVVLALQRLLLPPQVHGKKAGVLQLGTNFKLTFVNLIGNGKDFFL